MPHPRVLFVLADGARARFVQRVGPTPRFATFETLAQPDAAPGDFMDRVASRAAAVCHEQGFETVAVAAPRRLIGPLRDQLATHARVIHSWPHDLTKTPDADLRRWFLALPAV